MEISEVRPVLIPGTLLAGGTLTAEMDIGGFTTHGLISDGNLINSTLSFQVSAYSDTDTVNAANYVDVRGSDGAVITIGPVSGAVAVQAVTITEILQAFRYVKIKTALAQTNGVKFYIPAKA